MNITILGAGAWGSALAIALAQRHNVLLWGRNEKMIAAASAQRENVIYLPGLHLPATLIVTADFAQAIDHVSPHANANDSLLIVASSVAGIRSLAEQLRDLPIPNIVWLCKGFEEQTRLLPHQIVRQVLGDAIPAGALSGPSFAQEVAHGMPCALAIATDHPALSERVVAAVHGGNIRVYSTDDMVGVEVGGAVKNIMAIATGIADGLNLGLNARAALITRGLAEITRLGIALGGRSETFMGLSGVGDLILTCTGDLSRNRKVGLGLARGKSLADVVAELGHVAEGVRCAAAVRALAQERGVDMPITNAVAGVLFDGDAPAAMVELLLARTPREESA
ncbi:NAD(P)H-dependent glycerol-3-phosphate dehydrogenase [Glaciimonas sp. PCH181]|uniref:NAD(P)H-dependent glycerol-3-phosphate dehydrogenase n=1 Tax=Glaciimonas sp. PCH181 TaxID=2133943 RepID=UPI000D38F3A7|nr:NAD(P)H-dependent glycerol-3-phosphate dehydrogenase [Glaciimonas sp. PCH181]PUA18192.1 glycerol-3-phosphate dehydrogenase [Glaciimonas sp. PCH181]